MCRFDQRLKLQPGWCMWQRYRPRGVRRCARWCAVTPSGLAAAGQVCTRARNLARRQRSPGSHSLQSSMLVGMRRWRDLGRTATRQTGGLLGAVRLLARNGCRGVTCCWQTIAANEVVETCGQWVGVQAVCRFTERVKAGQSGGRVQCDARLKRISCEFGVIAFQALMRQASNWTRRKSIAALLHRLPTRWTNKKQRSQFGDRFDSASFEMWPAA